MKLHLINSIRRQLKAVVAGLSAVVLTLGLALPASGATTGQPDKTPVKKEKGAGKDLRPPLAQPAATRQPEQPAARAQPATRPVISWSAAPDPGPQRWSVAEGAPAEFRYDGAYDLVQSAGDSAFMALCTKIEADHLFVVRDLSTGKSAGMFKVTSEIENPLLSPDGRYIAGRARPEAKLGSSVVVYSVKTGEAIHYLQAGEELYDIAAIAYPRPDQLLTFGKVAPVEAPDARKLGKKAPDPRHVPEVHGPWKLLLWDLSTGKQLRELDMLVWPHPTIFLPHATGVSPGGKYFAGGLRDGRIFVWDLKKGTLAGELKAEDERGHRTGSPAALAFSPDGSELAAITGPFVRWLHIWSMREGKPIVQENTGGERMGRASGLVWSPNGRQLLNGRDLLDRATGKLVFQVPVGDVNAHDRAHRFLDSNRLLIVGGAKDAVALRTYTLPNEKIDQASVAVRSGATAEDAGLPALTPTDLSKLKPIRLPVKGENAWPLVDPAPPMAKKPREGPFHLPPTIEGGVPIARYTGLHLSGPQAPHAIFVREQFGEFWPGTSHRKPGEALVEKIDLASGEPAGFVQLPARSQVLACSADGKLIAARFAEERIDVYAFGAQGGKHVVGFRMPDDRMGRESTFDWAAIVGEDRLLTLNRGSLVLWSLPDASPIYSISYVSRVALSPGGKYMALSRSKPFQDDGEPLVAIAEVASGQIKGRLDSAEASEFCFDATGRRLAIASPSMVEVWDLQTGEWLHEIPLSRGQRQSDELHWLSWPYLLAGKGLLVDVEREVVVWRYTTSPITVLPEGGQARGKTCQALEGLHDGRLWYIASTGAGRERGQVLTSMEAPHAEAKQEMEAGERMAIKPGSQVSLVVNVPGSEAYRKQVTDSLAERLRESGYVLAEGQPVRLVATTTVKGSRIEAFFKERIGRQTKSQDRVTVWMYDHKLALLVDDKEVWRQMYTQNEPNSYPLEFVLEKGQTAQDYFAALNSSETRFFLTGRLPKLIFGDGFANGAGHSRLTADGAEPAPEAPPTRR